MKIQALLFDGFDELDVFGVFEVLRMAGFEVTFKALGANQTVTAAHGSKIVCEGGFTSADPPALLIVPGGGWLNRAVAGAWAEAEKGDILKVLRRVHDSNCVIASVCTGSLLLGRAGLLKGRYATTNHAAVEDLTGLGAIHVNARVVDDGNIITAAGITCSLDLGLWLVERFDSITSAIKVSEDMEFERRGVIYRTQRANS